jgi:hypothetical protein
MDCLTLSGTRSIAWPRSGDIPPGFTLEKVIVGNDEGDLALEVAIAGWADAVEPTRDAMQRLHRSRAGNGIHPVVVAACGPTGTWIFGPNKQANIVGPLDREHATRLLQSALDETSGLAARHRLVRLYEAIEVTSGNGKQPDALRGIANSGLFATHELRRGVRARPDWTTACEAATGLLGLRSEPLIRKLGYTPEPIGSHAVLLKADGVKSRAVAVMLTERESFDGESARFAVSPVAFGLKVAEQREVSWLIVLRGSQLRLYPAKLNLGVGRKGLAETYFEIDLAVADASTAGFLTLVFSSDALADNGSCGQILASSSQYAVALGHRLREKVYGEVVPQIALTIADQIPALGVNLDREGLGEAYQLTLRIFFRLLFQAYAEDRKLLPYGENPVYDRHALKTLAKDFVSNPDQEFDAESSAIWDGLAQVWRVIDKGDKSWGVPAYNGGLFSTDPELQPEGALIERLRITNDVMGPVLRAMLIDTDPVDGTTGCIDFRSLSVREFGTIYEGLLESNLGLADTDLILDANDNWVPAKKGQKVDPLRSAKKGTVYFHDTSGARKGTGSYFTQSFVVEHLLEQALDPALDAHVAKVAALLAKGDQAGAADLFFDFRVGDLAMGSAHFLTAAIDHIEQTMAGFLDAHPIPGVTNELQRLEVAAIAAAGEDAPPPEKSSLLRRQIARRCIYGLDINPVAVELARVSIWIHTFVRGLPMSSLDHNLVCANSLTGVGSIDEALDVLVPTRRGTTTLFDKPIKDALTKARNTLLAVSGRAELDRKESQEVARGAKKAREEAEIAKLLFDAAVLRRIGSRKLVESYDPEDIAELAAANEAQEVLAPLRPGHLPALFPEVFLRENGGFDVLVGNPPWEKLHVEEHQWWGLRLPGLRSMPMTQRSNQIRSLMRSRPDLVKEYENDVTAANRAREVVASGPFPGIGSGHIDLYKAFAWRNWQLIRRHGVCGVVLPRGALNGSGTEVWRRDVLKHGTFREVCFLTNSGGWVFEAVHPQYTVGLTVLQRSDAADQVRFCGPFHSRAQFDAQRHRLTEVPVAEFVGWTSTAAFPLLPTPECAKVFRAMRRHPHFADKKAFSFRAVQGDLNAASHKTLFNTDLARAKGSIPVLTGGSFSIWEPDFGEPYAKAGKDAEKFVFEKLRTASGKSSSAFHGRAFRTVDDLPMRSARIAFRDICRPTDSRTCIPCLVPPGVLLVHAAPYLVRRGGDEKDEAFLLAVLSSIPFDWYVRRIVELHLTFELLDFMPIPRPVSADPLSDRAIAIAGVLAARDKRYATWARAVGVSVGARETPEQKADLEAELDAVVSHLYCLELRQVEHVFETFHRGWDYAPRLARVREHYNAWATKK